MVNDTDIEIPQRVNVMWNDPDVEETTDLFFTYKPDPEIKDVYPKFTIARYTLLFETIKLSVDENVSLMHEDFV